MAVVPLGGVADTPDPHMIAHTLHDLLDLVAADHARREAWLQLLRTAAGKLPRCVWEFDGTTLTVDAPPPRRARYRVTAHACPCPAWLAHRRCWHLAAHRLIVVAGVVAARRQADDPGVVEAIQAALDTLYR